MDDEHEHQHEDRYGGTSWSDWDWKPANELGGSRRRSKPVSQQPVRSTPPTPPRPPGGFFDALNGVDDKVDDKDDDDIAEARSELSDAALLARDILDDTPEDIDPPNVPSAVPTTSTEVDQKTVEAKIKMLKSAIESARHFPSDASASFVADLHVQLNAEQKNIFDSRPTFEKIASLEKDLQNKKNAVKKAFDVHERAELQLQKVTKAFQDVRMQLAHLRTQVDLSATSSPSPASVSHELCGLHFDQLAQVVLELPHDQRDVAGKVLVQLHGICVEKLAMTPVVENGKGSSPPVVPEQLVTEVQRTRLASGAQRLSSSSSSKHNHIETPVPGGSPTSLAPVTSDPYGTPASAAPSPTYAKIVESGGGNKSGATASKLSPSILRSVPTPQTPARSSPLMTSPPAPEGKKNDDVASLTADGFEDRSRQASRSSSRISSRSSSRPPTVDSRHESTTQSESEILHAEQQRGRERKKATLRNPLVSPQKLDAAMA